jgi:hypothetical protein
VIHHAREALTTVQTDGDLDAVVVHIPTTGMDTVESDTDRYRHTIVHGLGRVPIGCMMIHQSGECDMYVVSATENEIVVKFTNAEVSANVRIW